MAAESEHSDGECSEQQAMVTLWRSSEALMISDDVIVVFTPGEVWCKVPCSVGSIRQLQRAAESIRIVSEKTFSLALATNSLPRKCGFVLKSSITDKLDSVTRTS